MGAIEKMNYYYYYYKILDQSRDDFETTVKNICVQNNIHMLQNSK